MDNLIDDLLRKNNTEIKLEDNSNPEDFGIPEEILTNEKQWFLYYDQTKESIMLVLRQINQKSKR